MSPTRIDFYLLSEDHTDAHWLLACRLLEKAYYKGHKVFVYCANQRDAETIDELLWTFKDDSFIPHNLQGEGPEPPPAIQIGCEPPPRGFNDILLNLCESVPPFFTKFRRVFELVGVSEALKEQGRLRYKEYKSQRCAIFTHTL